ncbi:hypothetical protein PIB30_005157 [Stylosanthes scabra]|uniref:Uncharacterized protein n=1 Tax=Stylosanthes scabra TaxID=79078 RepID=A0ABU6R3V2_9FABA|nr:hypothetical protein [Stylosanthes scabra]
MALLLLISIVVFIKISNNHNYLATASSSGGVMGGSFFDDSHSSSSSSFSYDEPHNQHYYDSSQPSVDDQQQQEGRSKNDDDGGVISFFLISMFGLVLVGFCKHRNGNAISVLKVQVAMLGGKKGSSIQRDLTRIAQASDTSSPEGVDLKLSREDGEKCYTQLSHEERSKFDKETLVNFNGKEKISVRSQGANVFINDDDDYKKMLDEKKGKEEKQKPEEEKQLLINGFGNDEYTVAGEVLWTPQKDDETLSEDELIEDYPQLAKAIGNFLAKKKE